MSEKFVELSSLFLPKNKQKPEVEPENKNTSDCKLYQNITCNKQIVQSNNQSKEEKKKKKKIGKSKYPTQSIDLSKKTDL